VWYNIVRKRGKTPKRGENEMKEHEIRERLDRIERELWEIEMADFLRWDERMRRDDLRLEKMELEAKLEKAV